ncbi:MAG: hypothetical protein ACNI3A_17420 [Desulfovibrio sp.]|uniref:hypothetical protein n=1 Tax=Desulfovibrio sp. 7SRBS1 TaxID=3378064 RepID=UPI003B3FAADB
MQGITAANNQMLSDLISTWKLSDCQGCLPQNIGTATEEFQKTFLAVLDQNGGCDPYLYEKEARPSSCLGTDAGESMQSYGSAACNPNEKVETTSSSGTSVNVKRSVAGPQSTYMAAITTASGLHLELELSDDARITDLEDGGISVTYRGSGETHVYDAAGNKTVRQNESDTFAGTDKDDIFINLRGSEVDGGAGNDTIINFANNATLHGGDGDDTIILARASIGNTINAGGGNDSLQGGVVLKSNIDMGDGDNKVDLDRLGDGTKMLLGSGNNTINVNRISRSSIAVGNGKNIFDVNYLVGPEISLVD